MPVRLTLTGGESRAAAGRTAAALVVAAVPDVAVAVAAVTEDCSMDQRGEACGWLLLLLLS